MESPRQGNVTWRLRLPARARAPPSQPRMSCHAGKVNRRCRTGNRTAKAPSGEKPPQGRIRCGAVRSPQSGLSRNNREIRALFAYFGVERAEFLCSSDCVAGRPSHKPIVWYKGFLYQAASWKTARRVVAKVAYHAGELFPRVGFIVTNLETPSRAVVRFYNKRGTAEQWIKEGKQAVKMTRLSCHRFRSNQVRLALSLLAYNLGNLWRRLG